MRRPYWGAMFAVTGVVFFCVVEVVEKCRAICETLLDVLLEGEVCRSGEELLRRVVEDEGREEEDDGGGGVPVLSPMAAALAANQVPCAIALLLLMRLPAALAMAMAP